MFKKGKNRPQLRLVLPSGGEQNLEFNNETVKNRYEEWVRNKSEFLGNAEDLRPDHFESIKTLGRGAGGEVLAVKHKTTGIEMARKLIRLDIKPKVRIQIKRELDILHECNSPFVVGFFGSFHSEGEINILMEWMDAGSLDQVIARIGRIPENYCREICSMVVQGLVTLKEQHDVIHRDIKPSNVLLNRSGEAKLCDFGVSGNLINSMAETFVGTTSYMAPERVRGENYASNSDVWSLGVSMIELGTGTFPIPQQGEDIRVCDPRKPTDDVPPKPPLAGGQPSLYELLACIVDQAPPVLPQSELFSDEFREFVSVCCVHDSKSRPSQKQLLEAPWLSGEHESMDMKAWIASTMK